MQAWPLYLIVIFHVAFIGWLARYHRLLTADPELTDRAMGAGYTVKQAREIDKTVASAALTSAGCVLAFGLIRHWIGF